METKEEYANMITATLREHHLLADEEVSAIARCARGF
jgi:hypothetical protein